MILSTERTYYQDTYKNRLQATIQEISMDAKGDYVVFNKTLFHPQGGGQPNDEGYFQIGEAKFQVVDLDAPRDPNAEPYIIRHYIKGDQGALNLLKVGDTAMQVLDMEKRALYARSHTAGHLLSSIVEKQYPGLVGTVGNHFPDQSFVSFKASEVPDSNALKESVSKMVKECIQNKLPITNDFKGHPRTIQIGDFKAYPCGGTHLNNTSEIGEIVIGKVSKEKREGEPFVKVRYSLAGTPQ